MLSDAKFKNILDGDSLAKHGRGRMGVEKVQTAIIA